MKFAVLNKFSVFKVNTMTRESTFAVLKCIPAFRQDRNALLNAESDPFGLLIVEPGRTINQVGKCVLPLASQG